MLASRIIFSFSGLSDGTEITTMADLIIVNYTVYYKVETVLQNNYVDAIIEFIGGTAFTEITTMNISGVNISEDYMDNTALDDLESEGVMDVLHFIVTSR